MKATVSSLLLLLACLAGRRGWQGIHLARNNVLVSMKRETRIGRKQSCRISSTRARNTRSMKQLFSTEGCAGRLLTSKSHLKR